jgi:hypothetical protein
MLLLYENISKNNHETGPIFVDNIKSCLAQIILHEIEKILAKNYYEFEVNQLYFLIQLELVKDLKLAKSITI